MFFLYGINYKNVKKSQANILQISKKKTKRKKVVL